jgi:hypothetical protein
VSTSGSMLASSRTSSPLSLGLRNHLPSHLRLRTSSSHPTLQGRIVRPHSATARDSHPLREKFRVPHGRRSAKTPLQIPARKEASSRLIHNPCRPGADTGKERDKSTREHGTGCKMQRTYLPAE